MKIVQYNSQTQLMYAYDAEKIKHSKLLDCKVSVSYRTYNSVGNTIELHIFYK